jgi:hypothetical protein
MLLLVCAEALALAEVDVSSLYDGWGVAVIIPMLLKSSECRDAHEPTTSEVLVPTEVEQ